MAIKQINKNLKDKNVTLDVYGIPFEKINEINNQIQYKGILNYQNRLEIMSEYDFLVTASKSWHAFNPIRMFINRITFYNYRSWSH